MKSIRYITVVFLLLAFNAAKADADVNEILTFTNYTHEELYVELSIYDDSGWNLYDIYVLPNRSSIADFWSDSFFATYSACAYGEITGDFYGCINGGITDYYNNIYFDNTAVPYTSGPSGLPADVYVFENPNTSSGIGVIVEGSHSGGGGGCFINALFSR